MSKQQPNAACRHAIGPYSGINTLTDGRPRLRVVRAPESARTVSAHGGKRDRRKRLWRYPGKPGIEVPYRTAAAIAVMEMGINEYSVIAMAVGLTVEEIERVDMVEDTAVRKLALAGIPVDESFKLESRVRCPKCLAKVSLAPCIACRSL